MTVHRYSRRSWPFLILAGLAGLALVLFGACDTGTQAADDEPPRQAVEAPIDDLQLLIRESFPPQYALLVTSGLPSGCAQFNGSTVTRAGDVIHVRVTNTLPVGDNIACTAIYGFHEHTIELGSDFEPGQRYEVQVNDRELTFTAQ